MFSKTLKLGAVAVAMSFSSMAFAMPISGEIQFVGTAELNAAPSAATAVTAFTFAAVAGVTGTYAPIALGTTAIFTPFTFAPTLSPSPVNPLWEVAGGYKFRLDSITSNTYDPSVAGGTRAVAGVGMLMATGFDNTVGSWVMSANGSTANVVFSSASIPEPSVLALVGLGLVAFGLVGVGRRGRSSSQMLAA